MQCYIKTSSGKVQTPYMRFSNMRFLRDKDKSIRDQNTLKLGFIPNNALQFLILDRSVYL